MIDLNQKQYSRWAERHGMDPTAQPSPSRPSSENTPHPLGHTQRHGDMRSLVRVLHRRLGVFVGLIPIGFVIVAGFAAMVATMPATKYVTVKNGGDVASVMSARAAQQIKKARKARTTLSMLADAHPGLTTHRSTYRIKEVQGQTVKGTVRAIWSRDGSDRRTTSANVALRIVSGQVVELRVTSFEGEAGPYVRAIAGFSPHSQPLSK